VKARGVVDQPFSLSLAETRPSAHGRDQSPILGSFAKAERCVPSPSVEHATTSSSDIGCFGDRPITDRFPGTWSIWWFTSYGVWLTVIGRSRVSDCMCSERDALGIRLDVSLINFGEEIDGIDG
jgi:hypothetical protein